MKRREFLTSVRKEILLRAKDERGELRCENPTCRAIVRRGEIHHRTEDALELDKSRKLTAADGIFLCAPCHAKLTKAFAPVMAKVRAIEAKHLGAVRPAGKIRSAPFARPAPRDRTLTKTTPGRSGLARQYREGDE